jgi:hypothetical protein
MFYLKEIMTDLELNPDKYSTIQINKLLFDIDDNLTSNKYFINRNNYKIKSGKHKGITYYMLSVLEPSLLHKLEFIITNVLTNKEDEAHKEFLQLCLTRRRINYIFLSRL